jgi:hypothetical protein
MSKELETMQEIKENSGSFMDNVRDIASSVWTKTALFAAVVVGMTGCGAARPFEDCKPKKQNMMEEVIGKDDDSKKDRTADGQKVKKRGPKTNTFYTNSPWSRGPGRN